MTEKFLIEIAVLVLGAITIVLLFTNKAVRDKGPGGRTLQVLIVAIAGPIIIILGVEKILNSETIAAIVGAMIGFAVPRSS